MRAFSFYHNALLKSIVTPPLDCGQSRGGFFMPKKGFKMDKYLELVNSFVFDEVDNFLVKSEKDLEGIRYRLNTVLDDADLIQTWLKMIKNLLPERDKDTGKTIEQIDIQCGRVRESMHSVFKGIAFAHDSLQNLVELAPEPQRLKKMAKQVLNER